MKKFIKLKNYYNKRGEIKFILWLNTLNNCKQCFYPNENPNNDFYSEVY